MLRDEQGGVGTTSSNEAPRWQAYPPYDSVEPNGTRRIRVYEHSGVCAVLNAPAEIGPRRLIGFLGVEQLAAKRIVRPL